MALAATYSRASSSTTYVVTTATPHGLVVGDVVYADFTTGGGGTVPADGTYTLTAATSLTYTFIGPANGTTANVNGAMTYLRTNGDTYAQSQRSMVISSINHGFSVGQYAQLQFVGGTYSGQDGNYLVTIVNSNSEFVVTANTRAISAGGVRVDTSTAIVAAPSIEFDFDALGEQRDFHIAGSGSVTFEFDAIALERNIAFGCDASVTFDFAADGEVTSHFIEAAAEIDFLFRATANVGVPVFASPSITFDFAAESLQVGASFDSECRMTWNVVATLDLSIIRNCYSVRDLIEDAIKLWGRASAKDALEADRERLVADANACLEEMFSRAQYLDYFNRVTRQFTLTANTDSIDLPTDIQNLHGYVRTTGGKVVNPVKTQAEIERFADTFLSAADDTSEPHVYYLERTQNGGAFGFASALKFAPTPPADVVVNVEVTLNAPRLTWTDYTENTPLSVVHRYAASVLFPLMRKRTSSARKFVASEQQSQIDQQYAQARQILGYVDPTPKSTKSNKPQEAEPVTA